MGSEELKVKGWEIEYASESSTDKEEFVVYRGTMREPKLDVVVKFSIGKRTVLEPSFPVPRDEVPRFQLAMDWLAFLRRKEIAKYGHVG